MSALPGTFEPLREQLRVPTYFKGTTQQSGGRFVQPGDVLKALPQPAREWLAAAVETAICERELDGGDHHEDADLRFLDDTLDALRWEAKRDGI